MIINQEWGLAMNENPNQGSFVIDELTELVEEAVLEEFDRIAERGGVLGAMETGYQRGKIQDESMLYEKRKHDGSLPIIGVNTFLNPNKDQAEPVVELARSTDAEKRRQIQHVQDFQSRHQAHASAALNSVRQAAMAGENVFTELMNAVRVCSLGQLSDVLYEAGGKYRRNM
jgi:methylmalonyl-CoA mutase